MSTSVKNTDLESTKALIDSRLGDYCTTRKLAAAHISPQYELLWESIESLVAAGGKRLRPYLFLTAFQAYDTTSDLEDILPAALALELLHCAMLIHDDIIDRDDTRYGIKNIVGQYETRYQAYISDPIDKTHMARSSALLAGDVLISDAYLLFSHTQRPQELITKATGLFANAVFEVVGGELLDTEATFVTDTTATSEIIGRYKTASYSFIAPLIIGATLAGAPESELLALRQLANLLGAGYQLRDDLLGVFGDETKTGKSITTDIAEGKRTYLVEQFEKSATKSQKEQFLKIFHTPHISKSDSKTIRKLLVDTGAKESAEAKMQHLAQEVFLLIDSLSVPATSRTTLKDIATTCLQRDL